MELLATVHVAFITSLLFPVFRLITCQDQVQTPPTVSVTEGETATIECHFDPSNLVALDWRKGEDANSAQSLIRLFKQTVYPGIDPRFSISSNYFLEINGTTQADSGVYWCQVVLQGVFRSSANLTVLPVVTTTPITTTAPTTKPSTQAATTKRRTTSATAIHVDSDITRHAADSAPVMTAPMTTPMTTTMTTPAKQTSKVRTAKPTPSMQTSNNTTLYIIIGSCAGMVSLAILVLVTYCCCCKSKTPNGYSKASPNTPV